MTDQDTFSGETGANTDVSFDTSDQDAQGNITSDSDLLKKSNQHAQQHIKTLESETATMRQEIEGLKSKLEGASTVEEIMQRIDQNKFDQTTMSEQTAPQVAQLVEQVKEEILGDLSSAERARVESDNWAKANALLREKYGDKYSDFVDSRARDLQMTVDQMRELARTAPEAVLALVDTEDKHSPAPTTSSINTGAVSNQTENATYSMDYFRKIRAENPRLWRNIDFQKTYWQYLKDNVINKN